MLIGRRLGIMVLVLVAAALTGCRGRAAPCLADFSKFMAPGWTFVSQAALETDTDNRTECVVLYRFDTQTKEGRKITPVGGVVYRADHGRPRWIYPAPLTLPENFYLGEAKVTARVADVLSGSEGPELIVEDATAEGIITEASIFGWRDPQKGNMDVRPNPDQMVYKPLGSFVGDGGVQVNKDQVIVLMRRRDTRSQLADRLVYQPVNANNYFKTTNTLDLVDPVEERLVSLTDTKDPAASAYPEKTVLAFYENFRDEGQVSKLLSPVALDAWRGGRLAYGCPPDRNQVDRVFVQQVDYSFGTDAQPLILVKGTCKLRGGSSVPMAPTVWQLGRVDNKWQLQASGQ